MYVPAATAVLTILALFLCFSRRCAAPKCSTTVPRVTAAPRAYIVASLLGHARGWDIFFFGDADCLAFLEEMWGGEVKDCFLALDRGSFRADLWRYCVLYLYPRVVPSGS